MSQQNCVRLYADTALIKECKKKIKASGKSMRLLSQVLNMVGNEVRLKILYLLEEENGGLCVCDISDILEMTVPAVSQHLKKLKDAGIIEPKREGQTIFYSLNERNIDIIRPLFTHIKIGNKTKQVTY